MNMAFTEPLFGIALLLVPLVWFVPSRPRSITHGGLRTILFVLLILALMQPVRLAEEENRHFAIVLDQSTSLTEDARAEGNSTAEALLEQFHDEGSVTVVQLGGSVPLAQPQGSARAHRIHVQVDEESPLGDALSLAVQAIPLGTSGSITLISDGYSTNRYWNSALSQIQERAIPVHTLSLDSVTDDVYLSRLRAETARAGESFSVWVDLIGRGTDLKVVLFANDIEVARDTVNQSDDRSVLELQVDAQRAGFVQLRAELIAPDMVDMDLTNDVIEGSVAIQDPVQTLYLGGRQSNGGNRMAELLGGGFELTTLDFARANQITSLDHYDLAILDDASASMIPAKLQQQLVDAVRDRGLGLFMSGGEGSFGDGGFHTTPVAEILPLKLPGDEDKIDPSVALAIILDTSGSMAGTRIELAKHIARIAVRRMQPHDRIGIVEFYGNKHWAVPMQPASNKIEIDRAIGRMKAIGGTVLFPAIQEAYYGLKNVNTRFKHILLITDAGVEDSDYEGMLRRISHDRINLSTILVGQGGHNQIMSDMANWGQGRFYSVGNQFQLVELILKQPSTKKPSMYKQGGFALVALGGRGWWGSVQQDLIPPLHGYVETEIKDGAEVLLEEAVTRHPLLATWRFGLGRVTAFTSEPTGNGTRSWTGWDDYGEFLGRVLSRTASDNYGYKFDITRLRDNAYVTARATLEDVQLTSTLRVMNADRDNLLVRTAELRESAPGFFKAELPIDAQAALNIEGEVTGRNRSVRLASHPQLQFKGETQVDPRDVMDLAALSYLSGGLQLSRTTTVGLASEVSAGELSFVVEQLWPWLLLAALLLFLGELMYRRWPRRSS